MAKRPGTLEGLGVSLSMKILVTGASGMLGSDVYRFLEGAGYHVIAASRERMDVTQLPAVQRCLSEHHPDLVFHAAAHTDLDQAEREPDITYRINTIGTWNVALACARNRAQLVYVSTCGVFDGRKAAPYTELDSPNPLTHYHRSKYQAERRVAELVPEHFILRPGWLFGGRASHRRNYVANRYREALNRSVIRSATDRFGSPTYTLDFAASALEIVRSQAFGLYHVANSGACSRYEYVRNCLAGLGLATPLEPVTSDYFPRSAPVPAWEALDSYFLRLRGLAAPRPWQEALAEYVRARLQPELNLGAGESA